MNCLCDISQDFFYLFNWPLSQFILRLAIHRAYSCIFHPCDLLQHHSLMNFPSLRSAPAFPLLNYFPPLQFFPVSTFRSTYVVNKLLANDHTRTDWSHGHAESITPPAANRRRRRFARMLYCQHGRRTDNDDEIIIWSLQQYIDKTEHITSTSGL